jgi:PAS domain S-box-containing protein
MQITRTEDQLLLENEELRSRLAETEATLDAIRNGEVDAIVVSGSGGEKIFTLNSAETPYRIIIEEMDEGAVTISQEGIILFCNRRFAQLIDYPMHKVLGSNLNDFISECNPCLFQQVLQEGLNGRIKEEITTINRNGDTVYLHLSMCILPEGLIGKICIIVTDISELKKHQHNLQLLVNERTGELNKANLELKEINATKDKLFSIIAHDLRGPFTSLLGFSDLLIDNIHNYDIDKFRSLLYHINSAAKSAYTLMENLLIWARSQNKQMLFRPKKINVTTNLIDVAAGLDSLALIKNISLIFKTKDDIYGIADSNMLNTIVRNLISNAIKFCNPGGKIELEAISKNNEIEISINDNGVGISEELKSKLFKAEVGMTLVGTSHEKGTGLGLLICKEFVEKHGGKIWVESNLGQGSKFIFTLPQPETQN